MAEDRNPETVAVGVDLEVTAAEILFLVNDVPVFEPDEPFGGPEQIETQLRLNPVFRRGRNTVTVKLRMIRDGDLGYEPLVRMNFGYWEFMSNPFPFDDRPMAVTLNVVPKANANGEFVQEMQASVPGQALINATAPGRQDGSGALGEWNTYSFDVDLDIDLPAMAWLETGQFLQDGDEMRAELIAKMRQVHSALDQGGTQARQALDGYVSRQAASLGATADEYFEYTVSPVIDAPDQKKLMPFDVSDAELRLFGGGRLATFVPVPHRYDDLETGGEFSLYFYYWKDGTGEWHINH